MEWLDRPEFWASLVTLTALEIVLGIDNLVFISILVGRLPEHRRDSARRLGLALAAAQPHRPARLDRLDHRTDAAAVRAVRSTRSPGATSS